MKARFIPIILIILIINSSFAARIKRAVNWNGNDWALQCDFNGSNLSNVVITSDRCGPKCNETSGCNHFVWTRYNGGTCWMKSGAISKNDAFQNSDPTSVCGVVNRPSGSGSYLNNCKFCHG